MQAKGLQQSLAGIKAIAGLGGGTVVIWLVYQVTDPYLTDAKAAAPGGYGGVAFNDWMQVGLTQILPAAFVGLVLFGLIANGIYARQYR